MNEWISVEDKLPKRNGKFLVCVNLSGNKIIDIYCYADDLRKVDDVYFRMHRAGWYRGDDDYGYYEMTKYITHWMELPDFPKNRLE